MVIHQNLSDYKRILHKIFNDLFNSPTKKGSEHAFAAKRQIISEEDRRLSKTFAEKVRSADKKCSRVACEPRVDRPAKRIKSVVS